MTVVQKDTVSAGDTTISNTTFDDGYTGSVTINGNDGDDLIIAGRDNLIVNAGAGNDLVIGGTYSGNTDWTAAWDGTREMAIDLYASGKITADMISDNASAVLDGGDGTDILFSKANAYTTTPANFEFIVSGDAYSTIVVTTGGANTENEITLEEAIGYANQGVITTVGFAADVDTVTLYQNLTALGKDMSIVGDVKYDEVTGLATTETREYVTINGFNTNINYSIFRITAGVTVSMNDLFITQGKAENGGGIYNAGTLTLEDITVSSSTAKQGGGIYNAGTLTNAGTLEVTNNTATGNGGGIYNTGTFTNTDGTAYGNVTISNNKALGGGGVFNTGSFTFESGNTKATLKVENNEANLDFGWGAGITSNGRNVDDGKAKLTLKGVDGEKTIQINNNTAWGAGGLNIMDTEAEISNVSFSGNKVNTYGGALWAGYGAIVNLTNVKMDGNLTPSGSIDRNAHAGGGIWIANGYDWDDRTTVTVNNVTIENMVSYGNTDQPGLGGGIGMEKYTTLDIKGNLTITGTNTTSENQTVLGAGIYAGGTVNVQEGATLKLDNNQTSMQGGGLYITSDAVHKVMWPAGSTDIAYYSKGVVTIENDAEVNISNNKAADGAGIYIEAGEDGGENLTGTGVNGTLTNAGTLKVTNNKAIDKDTDDREAGNGAGIYNAGTLANAGTLEVTGNTASNNGGGIYNAGTLTGSVSLQGNSATNGAGLYVSKDAVETNVTFSDTYGNTASNFGGAVYVEKDAKATLAGTIGKEKEAVNEAKSGGGIYNAGTLTNAGMLEVTNNTATTGNGGGIYNAGGTLTLEGTNSESVKFEYNVAAQGSGGGIEINGGKATITKASFVGNAANAYGGAIRVQGDSTLDLTNVTMDGGTLNKETLPGWVNTGYWRNAWGGGGLSIEKNDANDNSCSNEDPTTIVNVNGLTITNMTVLGNESDPGIGGGIFTEAGTQLNLSGIVNISGCKGSEKNQTILGAGMYVGGEVNVKEDANVTIENNTTGHEGGGIYITGKARIMATDSTTVEAFETNGDLNIAQGATLTVRGNKAKDGAGIYIAKDTEYKDKGYAGGKNLTGTGVNGTLTNAGTLNVTNNTATNNGGGIYNAGTLTGSVSLQGNSATNGAGLYVSKNATETNVTFSDTYGNTASNFGGAVYVEKDANATLAGTIGKEEAVNEAKSGGGIYNAGTITVKGLTVTNNEANAYSGGGIYNEGSVKVEESGLSVKGNSAAMYGGGIYNKNVFIASAELLVNDNKTTGTALEGGGIYNSSTFEIKANSTISSNESAHGGGIQNYGTLSIEENVTLNVSNNTGGYGAGIKNAEKGIVENTGTLNVTGNNASSYGGGIYNVGTVNTSGTGKLTIGGNTDGNTEGNSADLRGGGLYNGGTFNIYHDVDITHNKADGGAGIYNADNGNVNVHAGTLLISDNSAQYKGGGIYNEGAFNADQEMTRYGKITIRDNKVTSTSSSEGGGLYNTGTFNVKNHVEISRNAALFGGGAYNRGTINVADGIDLTVQNNEANRGGGIYNYTKAMVNNGGNLTIKGNTSTLEGGGVYNNGTVTTTGTLVIGSNTVDETTANTAESSGGGVYNNGTFDIKGTTTIANNTAKSSGGGVYNNGIINIASEKQLEVANNSAQYRGGGIYNGGEIVSEGTLLVNNNKVYNTSTSYGGGIYNTEGAKITSNKMTVDGNTGAVNAGGGIYNLGEMNFNGSTEIKNNKAPNGAGMWHNGTLSIAKGATVCFESNAGNPTFTANKGGALYIEANGKTADSDKFIIDDQSDFRFVNNGTANTKGGAIYNAGNLEFACDYAFGVTVTTDENGVKKLAKNVEINKGIGAALYNVGTVANTVFNYDEFYAGSAEESDLDAMKKSEKTFSLYVANQEGEAAIGNGAGTMTLSNVKVYGNTGGGIKVEGGTVTLDKGTEIGEDQFGFATTGYSKYAGDEFTGNTGYGVNVTGGTLNIEQGEKIAKYWNAWKSEDAVGQENGRYEDYKVIDTVRISGNETGMIVSGGIVNMNDVRMEGNAKGMSVSGAGTIVNASQVLISDWTDSGITVTGGTLNLTQSTAASENAQSASALTNNGGTVTLVNSIAVNSDVTEDAQTDEYSKYNFQNDVLGNKYTLGANSVAYDAGVDADAKYTDGTAISSDLAGHNRVLYGNVDLGAFENPVFWIDGDDTLEDIKKGVETVEPIDFGGAVKFDISANGQTFVWKDQDNADWIYIHEDVTIDSRYLDSEGNYYWMDVTFDAANTSGTGLFRVIKDGVTANIWGVDIENAVSSDRFYPAGGVNVLTQSVVNLYGVSFKNCSGEEGGAIYAGRNAVVNIESATADGYVNDGTATKVENLYKLSVFEGNKAEFGGAVTSDNTGTSTTIGGVEYAQGLKIQGVDLGSVKYMDGKDWTDTLSAVTYAADRAVKQYSIQFIGNEAGEKGGAVYVGGTADIDGVSFIGNKVPGTTINGLYGGGAMYVAGNAGIKNADFLSNYSTVSGGAVVVTGTMTGTGNLVFAGNKVEWNPDKVGANADNGGAIYVYNGKLTLGGVTVTARTVYQDRIKTSGKANEFLGNEAYLGGAVMNRDGEVSITNGNFSANMAVDGGALYNTDKGTVSLDNVTFTNNLALDRAGAIFNAGSTGNVTVSNGKITGNYARSAGAGWNLSGVYSGNESYGTFNSVYDNTNQGEMRAVTEITAVEGFDKFGNAAVTNAEAPTLTITKAETSASLEQTGAVTEWADLSAEITTDAYAVSAGNTLTQEIEYDSTKFAADLDSLEAAEGWNAEVTEVRTENGRTTVQMTFTAEEDQILDSAVLGKLGFSTIDRLTESTELLGTLVEKMGYDMNTDDRIDISDLVLFARQFGTADAGADFNADGHVNINDLVKFARHFGEKRETALPAKDTEEAVLTPAAVMEAVTETPVEAQTETALEVAAEVKLDTVEAKAEAAMIPESAPVQMAVQDVIFSSEEEEEDWLDAICSVQEENEKDVIDDLFGNK